MRSAWALMIPMAVLLAGCATTPEVVAPPREVGVAEARALVAGGQVVPVDTRSPHEFDSGHIPGAVLVAFGSDGTAKKVRKAVGGKQPLLYCRNGRRSGLLLAELTTVPGVLHFKGGILAWKEAGLEVQTDAERPLGEEGISDVYRFRKPKGETYKLPEVYHFWGKGAR